MLKFTYLQAYINIWITNLDEITDQRISVNFVCLLPQRRQYASVMIGTEMKVLTDHK